MQESTSVREGAARRVPYLLTREVDLAALEARAQLFVHNQAQSVRRLSPQGRALVDCESCGSKLRRGRPGFEGETQGSSPGEVPRSC